MLAHRDDIAATYADLASRAALDLRPPDCWLLLRLGEYAPLPATDLPGRLQFSDAVVGPHLDRLAEQGDLTRRDGVLELTDPGRAVQRLIGGRSDQLAALLGDVTDEERPELMEVLHRLAASVLAAPAGRVLPGPVH